jgi:hypothetical protein
MMHMALQKSYGIAFHDFAASRRVVSF